MFHPFLVVGVGGSGGQTLRAARQALQSKLDLQGWDGGWPQAWQLLHIDSPITQDGLHFPAPLLPAEDYLPLVPSDVGYKAIYDKAIQGLDSKVLDVQRVLPALDDFPPINSSRPDMRAFGRTIAIGAMKEIHDKVQESLGKMQSTSADAELKEITRLFGAEVSASQTPTVIVISSLAGLSGSGMFIDVAEAIKAAIGPEEWAHRIFSLLFASDLFAQLGHSRLSSMVPNAMGALAELISGFWRSTPTEGTLALYKKHGLNVPQDTKSTIGPAFSYIIGRKNGNQNPIDFGSQAEAYKALANAVAAWMTDAVIQDDLSVYAAVTRRSASLEDNTRLATIPATQPLSSLGFARVSVGTDKFFEYAAERLAKQTLTTLLSQHILTDPELKMRSEEQWVEYYTALNEHSFLEELGLIEIQKNRVVEALAPDTVELQERLKLAINTAATSNGHQGVHSPDEWVSLMVHTFEANSPILLEDLSNLLRKNAREWVENMPKKILTLVNQTASRQGLPVTVKLLDRALARSRQAVVELEREQKQLLAEAKKLRTLITQSMEVATSMVGIPPNNDAVAQGVYQAQVALARRTEAGLREVAREILQDFAENFLEPLRMSLARGFNVLRNSVNVQKLSDGRGNPYDLWPSYDDGTVPKRFWQAPNESMLIGIEDFTSEFDTLLRHAVNDPTIMGSRLGEFSKLPETQQWDIVTVKQAWIPKNPHHQIRKAVNQPAVFALVVDHMEYPEFAKKWMMMPGGAFRGFLDQTIASYLQADGNQAAQSARSRKFLAAVRSAIESADPLVELDPKLLEATHGQIGRVAFSSGIPIEKTDPLRGNIDDALVSNGYDPDKGWYISGSKAANAKSIEIITQLTSAINPIPMASLMAPIAEAWSASSTDWSSRRNFMQWRRGRPLPESIPASPDQWQAMLNGWFVARMLNLLALDKSDPSFRDQGPRLSIWVDPAAGWVDFPYPLHSADIATNVDDFPAIVLDSLIVAMANCHAATSLQPLAAYQRLLDLGGSRGSWEDLSMWILDGQVQRGAPRPDPSRAGGPSGSPQERQDACAAYLEDVLAKFRDKMSRLDAHADSRAYPIAWELRNEVEGALDASIEAVRSIQPEEQW